MNSTQLFEIQFPGSPSRPGPEYEWVSLEELVGRVAKGRLDGREMIVGCPMGPCSYTVAQALQAAQAGAFEPKPAAPESPKPKSAKVGDLQKELAKLEAAQTKLGNTRKLIAEAKTELERLGSEIDLYDSKELDKATRLKTIASLGDGRLAAMERELAELRQHLLDLCHVFVHSSLAPRAKNLSERASAKIATKLKPYFRDQDDLAAAVMRSETMEVLDPIVRGAYVNVFDRDQAKAYANELIALWDLADTFEKQFLPAEEN